jgi:hypothetical protein
MFIRREYLSLRRDSNGETAVKRRAGHAGVQSASAGKQPGKVKGCTIGGER